VGVFKGPATVVAKSKTQAGKNIAQLWTSDSRGLEYTTINYSAVFAALPASKDFTAAFASTLQKKYETQQADSKKLAARLTDRASARPCYTSTTRNPAFRVIFSLTLETRSAAKKAALRLFFWPSRHREIDHINPG
jgi:hypothetical protein